MFHQIRNNHTADKSRIGLPISNFQFDGEILNRATHPESARPSGSPEITFRDTLIYNYTSLESSLGLIQDLNEGVIALIGNKLIEDTGARDWVPSALARFTPATFSLQSGPMLLEYYVELLDGLQRAPRQENSWVLDGIAYLLSGCLQQVVIYFLEHAVTTPSQTDKMHSKLKELVQKLLLSKNSMINCQENPTLGQTKDTSSELLDDLDEESASDLAKKSSDALTHATEFLTTGKAFENLCLSFKTFYYDEMGAMNRIRTKIKESCRLLLARCSNCRSLSLSNTACLRHELVYEVTFDMDWNLNTFLDSQYGNPRPRVSSLVVLAGSALNAQATLYSKYLEMVWPRTGLKFLEVLQASIDGGSDLANHSGQFYDSNAYSFSFSADCEHGTIHGSEEFIIEIAQMLAFTGSVLQSSSKGENVVYYRAYCDFYSTSWPDFYFSFKAEQLHPSEQSCWHSLFNGAAIARDFPIAKRGQEVGLEIPLNMMAAIGGVRHAVEYEGGVILKGLSCMFVPIKRVDDRIQWHLITSVNNDTRLPYHDVLERCPNRATLDTVALDGIQHTKAIVGWCGAAWSALGSAEIDYNNIDYSRAQQSNHQFKFSGGSLGFQQFGMAQADFTFGAKDGKFHFQRTGGPYKRIISIAERTPIALCDTLERRAWLVPASEVMLHIIHHKHFLEPFEVKGVPVKLLSTNDRGIDAKMVLEKYAHLDLSDTDVYMFKDEITSIWSILEFLTDQRIRQDQSPGFTLPSTLQDVVHGFEFKAIVEQRSPFRLKEASIGKASGGWVKLVRDIDALALFASEFGDVIRPIKGHADNKSLCHKWSTLPKEKGYLATRVRSLIDLYDASGYRFERTFLTETQLQLHRGKSAMFEPCQSPSSFVCGCTRLQQIVPKSAFGCAKQTGPLAENGAVIFGQAESPFHELGSSWKSQLHGIYGQPNTTFLNTRDTSGEEIAASSSIDSEVEMMSSRLSVAIGGTMAGWKSHDSTNDMEKGNHTKVVHDNAYAISNLQSPVSRGIHPRTEDYVGLSGTNYRTAAPTAT